MPSELYIGSPNGVVLCVDRIAGQRVTGRLYHRYSQHVIPFVSEEQAVFLMENLFDSLHFPYPSTSKRSFSGENDSSGNDPAGKKAALVQRQERIMSDSELLSKHGDLGSFIVRVQHRQNSSWQGTLTWMERNETLRFRSIWELIKLVESALDTSGAHDDTITPTWKESKA